MKFITLRNQNKKDMENFLEKEPKIVFYGYPPGMELEDIDEMIKFFEYFLL